MRGQNRFLNHLNQIVLSMYYLAAKFARTSKVLCFVCVCVTVFCLCICYLFCMCICNFICMLICNCILYLVYFGCSLYLGIICIQEWLPRLGDPKGIVTHPLGELQVLVSGYPDIKHLCQNTLQSSSIIRYCRSVLHL